MCAVGPVHVVVDPPVFGEDQGFEQAVALQAVEVVGAEVLGAEVQPDPWHNTEKGAAVIALRRHART